MFKALTFDILIKCAYANNSCLMRIENASLIKSKRVGSLLLLAYTSLAISTTTMH